jgi:biopolymer transport protein ExbB/TolQ
MQASPPEAPHVWVVILSNAATAIIVAVVAKFPEISERISRWRNRKHENEQTDAQSDHTRAETETIKITNIKSASDFMLVWMQKATEFKFTIEQLEQEMNRLKVEADKVLILQHRIGILEEQNGRMSCALDMNRLDYDGNKKVPFEDK